MVAHLTMILLIYFLAAVAVHAIHQRHLSRPETEGFEQILLIPSNQEHRIEGIVRALCRELVYRGKSFTMTVVAERKESETVRIIEKLMLRHGMELSYLSAVPSDMERALQTEKHGVRLIDLREPKL
ncbi:hypothetical protein J2W91_005047 [Paenibacillus amylolyticus]|uniref:Uncharacterized protein n=1 Tax=Paenibacillus amylolyticus TaxID=1451 RepID=A0AAP5H9R9_PAEAM|nr:hypothetical protein [Paenibacillus amylolyticus]MDR6726526.1 hypothetical protein [Paenibacillus amylolyticus]